MGLSLRIGLSISGQRPVVDDGELIVDGDFDLGNTDEWTVQDVNITLSVVSGEMRMDLAGASDYSHIQFPTEVGLSYIVSMYGRVGVGTSMQGQLRTDGNSTYIKDFDSTTTDGVIGTTFTATHTITTIRAILNNSGVPAHGFIDKVSAKIAP